MVVAGDISKDTMFRIAGTVATTFAIGISVASAQEPVPTPTPVAPAVLEATQPLTYWQENGCQQRVLRGEYVKALRKTYAFSHHGGNYLAREVTKRERKLLRKMRSCARDEKARIKWVKITKKRKKNWRFHHYIDRITPYGEWAIPSSYVWCESKFSYTVWNEGGSGASGAYQFKQGTWLSVGGGKYASHAAYAPPWVQHIMASRLVAIRGFQPWECA